MLLYPFIVFFLFFLLMFCNSVLYYIVIYKFKRIECRPKQNSEKNKPSLSHQAQLQNQSPRGKHQPFEGLLEFNITVYDSSDHHHKHIHTFSIYLRPLQLQDPCHLVLDQIVIVEGKRKQRPKRKKKNWKVPWGRRKLESSMEK